MFGHFQRSLSAHGRWPALAWLAISLASLALLLFSALWTPLSNDAGAYLTVAGGLLDGRLPYRDLFDHKTPGIYALFAAVLAASGRSLLAVQMAQVAAVVSSAVLTGWLAGRMWGRLAGRLAALLALYGGAAYAGAHLTTEAWLALCTAAALLVLVGRRPATEPRPADWLAAGALVGVSALFKQTGLLTLGAFACWALLLPGGWRWSLRRWLWLLAGCSAPLLLTGAWFAWQGALDELWRDAVLVNLSNYPPQGARTLLQANLLNLRAFPVLWLGLLASLVLWPDLSQPTAARDLKAPALLWLTLLASALPLAHHGYSHYVLQALPPAALLAGAGLAAGWRRLSCRPKALRAAALVGFLALAFIDLFAWSPYLDYTKELARRQAQAAAAIASRTQPGEPILAVTAAAQFYFLSNRPPASRWLYLYPINHSPAREAEISQLITGGQVGLLVVDDRDPLRWHARLRASVEAACRLEQSFGADLHLYRCRSASLLDEDL